jgi:hypothetical protein
MTSNINSANIDPAFPVAGTDNDTQGFRDNFTNTKNNFTYAKSEIEDLQSKAILKSALTGDSLDNDMGNSTLFSAVIRDFSETRVALGTTSGTVTIDYTLGHYQTYTMNGSSSLSFTNFPSSGELGRVRVEVTVTNVAHTVTLPSAVSVGTTDLMGFNASNASVTFDTAGTYILEFTTHNGGTTIAVEDMSRNRTRQEVKTPVNTGQQGDVPGMMVVDGSFIYVCVAAYDGSTAIWTRATLAAY